MKISLVVEKAILIGLLLFALACEAAKLWLIVNVIKAVFTGEILVAIILGALAIMANSISGSFVEAVEECI